LLNGISKASDEQAQGVEQINTAVSQMDKVTQQNAAGAEESASAAEELTAQAQTVKGLVDDLVAIVGAKHTKADGRSRNIGKKPAARPRVVNKANFRMSKQPPRSVRPVQNFAPGDEASAQDSHNLAEF
ncbi:MAG: methyl-accepting chemotaxis protein, partial [Planctomycetes bacterium]|nr:methyl-accepting chemotaxis protein [Planctomycetota bacterium]